MVIKHHIKIYRMSSKSLMALACLFVPIETLKGEAGLYENWCDIGYRTGPKGSEGVYQAYLVQNKNIQNIEDSIHILDTKRNMKYLAIKVHPGLFVAPQSSIFCVSLFGLTTAVCLQGSVFSGAPTSEEAKHIRGKSVNTRGWLHNLIQPCHVRFLDWNMVMQLSMGASKANRERGAGTWAMFAKDMPISSLYTAPT